MAVDFSQPATCINVTPTCLLNTGVGTFNVPAGLCNGWTYDAVAGVYWCPKCRPGGVGASVLAPTVPSLQATYQHNTAKATAAAAVAPPPPLIPAITQ
jgi:hypothetical protein